MQMVSTSRLIFLGSPIACLLQATKSLAQEHVPTTLAPQSTPAHQIFELSVFVVAITGGIFIVVGGLLAIALFRFRARKSDPSRRAGPDLRQYSN